MSTPRFTDKAPNQRANACYEMAHHYTRTADNRITSSKRSPTMRAPSGSQIDWKYTSSSSKARMDHLPAFASNSRPEPGSYLSAISKVGSAPQAKRNCDKSMAGSEIAASPKSI